MTEMGSNGNATTSSPTTTPHYTWKSQQEPHISVDHSSYHNIHLPPVTEMKKRPNHLVYQPSVDINEDNPEESQEKRQRPSSLSISTNNNSTNSSIEALSAPAEGSGSNVPKLAPGAVSPKGNLTTFSFGSSRSPPVTITTTTPAKIVAGSTMGKASYSTVMKPSSTSPRAVLTSGGVLTPPVTLSPPRLFKETSTSNTSLSSSHNNNNSTAKINKTKPPLSPSTQGDNGVRTGTRESLSKGQFMSVFETVYNSMEAQSTMQDQVKQTTELLETLKASGKLIEGLVRKQFMEMQQKYGEKFGSALTDINERLVVIEEKLGLDSASSLGSSLNNTSNAIPVTPTTNSHHSMSQLMDRMDNVERRFSLSSQKH